MAKAKATADTSLCKECRLCVNYCPKKAIEPLEELNAKGYKSSVSTRNSVSVAVGAIRYVQIMCSQ